MPKLIDADKLKQHYAWWDNEDKKIFDTIIDLQPDAVRHGYWIWMGEQGDSRYMCSVCKSKEDVPTCNGEPTIWVYCPNCGAKMDEEDKDAEIN